MVADRRDGEPGRATRPARADVSGGR